MGRKLAGMIFAFSRQAPLSYREIPEAAIASHLSNRFIVALSKVHFGSAMTPPILYTRYDPQTGGYVHAFPYIEGRPLQPWNVDLPLLGEAALFTCAMREWRDFLVETGFWGLARQVDPANFNSYSNIWITPNNHVLVLDVVPGIPGIEPKYLWWGMKRGDFPPFADAIDFGQLTEFVQKHSLDRSDQSLAEELALLRLTVKRWKMSEPRLGNLLFRELVVFEDPMASRQARREALIRHLEVKGVVSSAQAEEYRATLSRTGEFPELMRHTALKMAPLLLHRALTNSVYLLELLQRSWRLPIRLVRAVGLGIWRGLTFSWRSVRFVWKLLTHPQARLEYTQQIVGQWIDKAQRLGRLDAEKADRFRLIVQTNKEASDLSSLFVIHLVIGAVKFIGFGPTSLALVLTALATGHLWLAVPALIDPALRVATTLWIGRGHYLGALLFSALPSFGVLAAPLSLLKHQPELGNFIIQSLAQETTLRIPGFGERGSLTEMLGAAGAQVFVVDSFPVLPAVLITVLIGATLHWPWLIGVGGVIYGGAVLKSVMKHWRDSSRQSLTETQWKFGLPDRYLELLAETPPVRSSATQNIGLEEAFNREQLTQYP